MDRLHDAVQAILRRPTPEALVALQGALLPRREQDEAVADTLKIAGHFYAYLCDLQSKLTSKNYSELASLLDIGAVGAVALENVLAARGKDLWQGLLMGGLAEALLVAASRQYVKGWKAEAGLVHAQSIWVLTDALWQVSVDMLPELAASQRWQAIQSLLAPANDPDVPAPDKALLLGRIFQILLLTQLARSLPATGLGE